MGNATMYAGLGKTLRRKSDGMDFGNEITLGFTHYIGGVRLDSPVWELPEHYERVEIPKEQMQVGDIHKDYDGLEYTFMGFDDNGDPRWEEGIIEIDNNL